jgi:putative Mg2+ transporter-C (MgtC) family protein
MVDWPLIGSSLLSVGIAYALALPVGWDREQEERSAGLRTFPLVAVASCGYILLAQEVLAVSAEAQARVVEGLITGIGFIGGGAILKTSASVRGTATAASIWSTGAIGGAVAYERYEIAIILSIINFATLRWLGRFKPTANMPGTPEGMSEPEPVEDTREGKR